MTYDEFLDRRSWRFGGILQVWQARRLLSFVWSNCAKPPSECSVLEVGCGTGELGRVALRQGVSEYVGVEPNMVLAALSRKKLNECLIVEKRLPNVSETLHKRFDLVLAIHVLEHAPSGLAAREWLMDLVKCVSDDGSVVVVSPHSPDYKFGFWDIDWTHSFPTSKNNLKQIAADCNFEILTSKIMRLGTTTAFWSFVGYLFGKLFPVRLLNILGQQVFGRDIGTGIMSALFWGAAVIVVSPQKPNRL